MMMHGVEAEFHTFLTFAERGNVITSDRATPQSWMDTAEKRKIPCSSQEVPWLMGRKSGGMESRRIHLNKLPS
jgi:hypothetical protein